VNFTPADAPPLRALLDEMSSCADPDRYIELNHRFHMGLYKLSRRERLIALQDLRRVARGFTGAGGVAGEGLR